MGIVVKINIRGKTEKMETCFDFGREEELGPALTMTNYHFQVLWFY